MAGGKGRGGGTNKRKATSEKGPKSKLKREESENSQIRKAIKEAKGADSKNENKKYRIDMQFTGKHYSVEIYEDYSCMLNQTNIGHNNNKYYVIQVGKEKKKFFCFSRWGRVGEYGQTKTDEFNKAEDAVKAFKKKFKDKTKNDWDKRENFTQHSGKYTMIEIDEDDDDEYDCLLVEDARFQLASRALQPSEKDCSLPYRTQLMISLIFTQEMFNRQMEGMSLDLDEMPLGKVSKSQINKGLEALIDLEEAIKSKKSKKVFEELTSKFYTLIPHSFGRTAPPVLDTQEKIRKKKNVMLILSDIELTQTLQKEKANPDIHPILEKYEMLDCDMKLLDKKSSEFKLLEEYANACPYARSAKLLDVWTLDRKEEKDRFSIHDAIENRKLLWHGTCTAVIAAILKAGLRIMPHSGGSVGRGIYFASEYELSSCFVDEHQGKFEGEENVGFMFLTEVALGKESTTLECVSYTAAPKGYDSVVARGHTEPDPKKDKILQFEGKSVTVPVGKPIKQKQFSKSDFAHSEYLIYKESQARLRFLLKFSFI